MNKRGTLTMRSFQKFLCLWVAAGLCLTAGCSSLSSSTPSAASSSSSGEDPDAITVSGVVTAVNGNEVTLELVTLGGGMAPGSSSVAGAAQGEEAPAGADSGTAEKTPGEGAAAQPSGSFPGAQPSSGPAGEKDAAAAEALDAGQAARPAGADPAGPVGSDGPTGERGPGSGPVSYRRTGETAVYQIPIGAPVTTLAGTVKDFNFLATDTLITITLEEREDGTLRPVSVRVLQSV